MRDFETPEIGTQIVLKLKGGGIQEGIIKSLTDKEILIERDRTTLGLRRAQLSTASRIRCFASDYAAYKAHKQTKQEREAFEARDR